MSLCHVRLLSARASFLPGPSPHSWHQVTPIGPGHAGVRKGQPCTCGAGGYSAAVRARRWGRAPRLLVGEAICVGEELLRGEPILRHVAGAAADQVVRHAAGRHRDPT